MNDTTLNLTLRKSYPGFDLSIDSRFGSGVTAIFGPSGSGKTTILNAIAGLIDPDDGEITLRGKTLFSSVSRLSLAPERRRVGYVFQDGLLFPHMSVRENVMYGYNQTPPEARNVDPDHLVNLLDLGRLMDRRPKNLSAGERQRVALARAVAASPELLLMDEPLGSLDIALRGRVLRYLGDLHRSLGMPMVYVSHSISEALALAHQALVISNGRQLAFDEPRKVLLEPYVHSLVHLGSLENLLDVRVTDSGQPNGLTTATLGTTSLRLTGLSDSVSVGDTLSIGIRAGDIIIAVDRPERISARNILKGRLDAIHRIDHDVLLFADVGAPLMAQVTPDALDSLDLHEGQDVYLVIKSSSIMVLG